MKREKISVPGMSRTTSWHWNREDFSKQWEFLREGMRSGKITGETIWDTTSKDVRLFTVPGDDGPYRVAFKNYFEKRVFRYLFRPSQAAREALGFKIAESLGIPLVEVLAFGETRRFFRVTDAYFVTRFAEGTETMLYFKDHPEERELLLRLLRENIVRLARLHAAGYIYGGAHPRNILWRRAEDGSADSLWLDMATVRKMSLFSRRWKYLLTDLSDFTEAFRLTQEELDLLAAEYRKISGIPAAYRLRTDHVRKFSEAFRIR